MRASKWRFGRKEVAKVVRSQHLFGCVGYQRTQGGTFHAWISLRHRLWRGRVCPSEADYEQLEEFGIASNLTRDGRKCWSSSDLKGYRAGPNTDPWFIAARDRHPEARFPPRSGLPNLHCEDMKTSSQQNSVAARALLPQSAPGRRPKLWDRGLTSARERCG
jgi:hypothetical protein